MAVGSADLVGALFAQGAQVDCRPRAVGTPSLGDLGQCPVRAVTLDDLSVQVPLVAGQDVGSVGATQHHQLGRERPQPLDLLDRSEGVVGVDGPQCGAVEAPLERGVGDGVQVLGLAAGKAPSSPWRSTRSPRSRAACTMRTRWDSTDQAAASYGEWNPHGRNPGSCA